MQDSFETEKPKSNRTSPNAEDSQYQSGGSRRKGSIRFYDEVQSVDEANKKRNETASVLQQDDSGYPPNGYEYKESLQEYNSQGQGQNELQQQQQQQQDQIYSQHDYTDQPHDVYATGDYDASQYVDQQNYDRDQYGTGTLQPADEYNYQTEYQGYDTQKYDQQGYQSNEQPPEPTQPQEQYNTGMYQESTAKPTFDTPSYQPTQPAQPQQSYTEPSSSTTTMGQKYKGNGNSAGSGQRQQSVSKQPAKKKFT